MNDDLKRNAEGYIDRTAYKASINVENATKKDEDYERFSKLLDAIFNICDISDFHIEGRIVVRDKRNGKIWR